MALTIDAISETAELKIGDKSEQWNCTHLKVINGVLTSNQVFFFQFIDTKQKCTVVDMIIKMWISMFGSVEVLIMDNGGEFPNDEVRELGNQLSIVIKHTASYAPWVNGLNECNHTTVDVIMEEDDRRLSRIVRRS